jgi:DNA-binding GntR family transcriptional regulator
MPAVPLWRQIMADIKKQIETGALRPGDKLPSARELAGHHRCSVEPVKVALRTLQETGVVEGRPGRGVYVLAHQHAS